MPLSRMEKISALSVSLLPVIYFLPAIFGQIVLCDGDGWTFFLPLRVAAARLVLNGEFPLWNPYMFGGMPLLGAIQGGVLFPPNWIFLIFPPQTAMNFTVIFAYMTAGLGAYCYARRAEANIPGAFVTGFVWQCCGFMIAPMGHTASLQAASLLPWILWSIDGYGITGRRSRAVLIAIFVALQIFAGHPQTFVYSAYLSGCYALVMAFRQRPVNRFYIYSLVMILAGMALASVQLIPTLELTHHSLRNDISYDFFASFSMPPSFLFNFFAPFIHGGASGQFFQLPYTGIYYYGEHIGYVGLVTLLLAFAASIIRRDVRTVFWSVVVVVCLILALGEFLPFCLYRIVYYIPGLNLFRAPTRHLMEVDFGLAVLAGRALTVITVTSGKAHAKKLFAVSLCVFILTLIVVFGMLLNEGMKIFDVWLHPEFWCPLTISVTGLFLMWMLGGGYRHSVKLVIVVIVFDLCLWGQFSGWHSNTVSENKVFSKIPVIDFLQEQQNNQAPFRVLSLAEPSRPKVSSVSLQPDTYMLGGIQNVSGYDAFGLQRFSDFADGMKVWGELDHPLQNLTGETEFDLLNVRYLITKRTADGKILTSGQAFGEERLNLNWKLIAQFDDIGVYQNLSALPRAWLAAKVIVLTHESEILKIIRTGKFADGNLWDPRQTVLLDAPIEASLADQITESEVILTKYTANRIQLKTNCAASSILVLAENDYPGWQVKVDGQEKEILRVNYNLRGVALTADVHEVEFLYRPKSFLFGMIISLSSLIVLIIWWRYGIRNKTVKTY